ncbi:MAG: hypothetical protein ACD_38C00001G0004 [uncultured bacterium]|uniref:Uncharacterized protein n=1 Tax=Candidatus Daviesbacteria bacterium GW2011_GWC2_40_12 TaxID=1618431 RepID=A0A0G0QX84_9BACT|nr:MAG: hypothetical protein ACD_38C00001G0004 [uncultured bacterium]KKQ83578.1 MAG: hypothetical protein UT04_C0029G0004 [Candidatus Daviesbacteria bacterium GW2011_GWF2_38_7]KKR15925.1 MAG: hypothetical protein UT45_C0011G0008 [Candidatus Daviesbacteria bacterium GW2011_GWA2_39_33]KKR25366.1 MAG: hypothetical protein UT54_C0004G0011 [Candidatus Daviesbacteria bacterium GW2011_GWB1_39_5]KKR42026.1 MAG: hypothetical protein UT77_C0004G0010 [Candidatus Daviesbacteria bacterium GW2011_GWC2_40_12]
MLIRTTLRLKEDLKKTAEKKALQDDVTLQEIFNKALAEYLEKDAHFEAKKIIFKTHHLGEPLDNLTRDDFYPDPNFK